MRRIFAGLVSDEIAEAYEHLLEANGVPQPDADVFSGGAAIADTLRSLGMATLYTPPALEATASPKQAGLAGILCCISENLIHNVGCCRISFV